MVAEEQSPFRVQLIYGNPKHGGFVHGCVDYIGEQLEKKGAEVDRLHLIDAKIEDCTGCFTCLRTGRCPLEDDMPGIIERMSAAQGLVTGASVRNSFFPALYKRFYERITYIVGFGRDLRWKPVLAIGAVGMATGRKPLGRVLTLRDFQTHVVDYLFFKTGMPTKVKVEDVAHKLERAAGRLHECIIQHRRPSLYARLMGKIDDLVIRKIMLERDRDNVFDYVIARWKEKGLM